jgi:hypothetical protein
VPPIIRCIPLLVVVLALPATAAAASGAEKTEIRAVGGFHGLALGVPALLTIRQGAKEGLTITGDDDIVPRVESVVDDGTLEIRWARKGNYVLAKPLVIAVDAKTLDAIALGGNGSIRAADFAAPSLSIKVGGSGEVAIDRLDAKSATITVGGSGRVVLGGRADALQVTLAGAGEMAAGKLESRQVRATLQGSARATVWAKDSLDVTLAGSCEVGYYGGPRLRQTVAGNGRVRALGDAP